jgi:thiol-disulfide isomerase/thioredoxin
MTPTRLALLAAALLCTAGPAGCGGKDPAPAAARLLAPDVGGTTLQGEAFALRDLQGRVVLLNVWATWCEPCRDELPELARLHEALAERGLTVVGLNVDVARLRGRVAAMAHDFALPFPVVLDPGNATVGPLQVVGYPTSFVIGRDGTIRWRRDGIILPDDAELRGVLEAALSDE